MNRRLTALAKTSIGLARSGRPLLAGADSSRFALVVGDHFTGNFGDLLCWYALADTLRESGLRPLAVPRGGRRGAGLLRRLRDTRATSGIEPVIVVGGGTLIGRSGYRERLSALDRVYPEAPLWVLGPGVEDPRFESDRTDDAEMRAWSEHLARVSSGWVRGSRSRELLRSYGVDLPAAGDAAFALLGQRPPTTPRSDTTAAVSLIGHDEAWGSVSASTVRSIVSDVLADRGYVVTPIVSAAEDAVDDHAWKRLESGPSRVERTLRTLEDTDLVIGGRLHVALAAAALGRPTVAIEYRPKFADALSTLPPSVPIVRTSDLTHERLHAAIDQAMNSDLEACRVAVTAAGHDQRRIVATAARSLGAPRSK